MLITSLFTLNVYPNITLKMEYEDIIIRIVLYKL